MDFYFEVCHLKNCHFLAIIGSPAVIFLPQEEVAIQFLGDIEILSNRPE
jgi:hypothetical protein